VTKLPADLSGMEVRAALERAGFELRRQKGSHMVLVRREPFSQVVVPNHAAIKSGTLRGILRGASIPVDHFVALVLGKQPRHPSQEDDVVGCE
jgi:predicted RNA binding protein YcfA (HicA-like mRNA interferase family)